MTCDDQHILAGYMLANNFNNAVLVCGRHARLAGITRRGIKK